MKRTTTQKVPEAVSAELPLTIKHLPVDRLKWAREIRGIHNFILALNRHEKDEGREWVNNMQRYYVERFIDLIVYAPSNHLRMWAIAFISGVVPFEHYKTKG